MNAQITALLLSGNLRSADEVRQLLQEAPGELIHLESTSRVGVAVDRVAALGIDLVLLDNWQSRDPGLEAIGLLRREAPGVPVIVLGVEGNEAAAFQALRDGAQDYLPMQGIRGDALGRAMRYALARGNCNPQGASGSTAGRKRGRAAVFLGAKGGVGTTTVAANVAFALAARQQTTALIELRAYPGSLRNHLLNRNPARDIGTLLGLDASRISQLEFGASAMAMPSGPAVLFAPEEVLGGGEIRFDQADAIVEAAIGSAECAILDLPAVPSAANRAALRRASLVVLVCDRDRDSVASAASTLGMLNRWMDGTVPGVTVVVHRVALACPVSLKEIAETLKQPVVGVIPPAADACAAAHRVLLPLVLSQPESSAARALVELADTLVSGCAVRPER